MSEEDGSRQSFDGRSVRLSTGRTSLRLEPEFWDRLTRGARAEKTTMSDIVERAARERPSYTRSSAVRVFLIEYYDKKFSAAWSRLRHLQSISASNNGASWPMTAEPLPPRRYPHPL